MAATASATIWVRVAGVAGQHPLGPVYLGEPEATSRWAFAVCGATWFRRAPTPWR